MPPAKRFGQRYPWDDWFSREEFTLTLGKDFTTTPWGMGVTVRSAALSRGIRVSVRLTPETVNVRVIKGKSKRGQGRASSSH